MEIHSLNVFVKVVEHKSFTRAAEDLLLTQPAVSHQIRLLEEEFSQKLFEQVGRKIRLTLAGEQFYTYAQRILALATECKRGMEQLKEDQAGRITIGAIGSTTVYVLPDILYKFRLKYPRIEISLQTEGGEEIREMVFNGLVDIGIVGSHVNTDKLVSIRLFRDRISPFIHSKHPLAAKKTIKFAEVASEPLIQLGNWRSWEMQILSLFQKVNIKPNISLQLDSLEAVKSMVERGLGFTIIPHIAARTEVQAGTLVSLNLSDVPSLNRDVLLIHRPDKHLNEALKNFIQFMRQETRNIGEPA